MHPIKILNDSLIEIGASYFPIADIRKFGIRKGNMEITFSQEVVVIPCEEPEFGESMKKELIDIVSSYYRMANPKSRTRLV